MNENHFIKLNLTILKKKTTSRGFILKNNELKSKQFYKRIKIKKNIDFFYYLNY
jgi:hypothetical protein